MVPRFARTAAGATHFCRPRCCWPSSRFPAPQEEAERHDDPEQDQPDPTDCIEVRPLPGRVLEGGNPLLQLGRQIVSHGVCWGTDSTGTLPRHDTETTRS